MDHKSETEDGKEVISSAVAFNSEQHVEFIEETLSYYNISIDESFITNQISDNARVNFKIGHILGIKSVGCNNHKLNLEIEKFVCDNCTELLQSINDTMKALKNKTTLHKHLEAKIEFCPILSNETR
jgi:hypothetical protein